MFVWKCMYMTSLSTNVSVYMKDIRQEVRLTRNLLTAIAWQSFVRYVRVRIRSITSVQASGL